MARAGTPRVHPCVGQATEAIRSPTPTSQQSNRSLGSRWGSRVGHTSVKAVRNGILVSSRRYRSSRALRGSTSRPSQYGKPSQWKVCVDKLGLDTENYVGAGGVQTPVAQLATWGRSCRGPQAAPETMSTAGAPRPVSGERSCWGILVSRPFNWGVCVGLPELRSSGEAVEWSAVGAG